MDLQLPTPKWDICPEPRGPWTFFVLIPWLLIVAFWIAVIGGGGYLLVRLVRAYERRSAAPGEFARLDERIRALEESHESMEAEMMRLADAERFTTQLLSEGRSDAPE